MVYQQQGKNQEAVKEFRGAIERRHDAAAPRVLLGTSLLALGQTAEAVAELEKAIQLHPVEAVARIELSRAYELTGNAIAMVEQLRLLRDEAPNNSEYAYLLGRAYLKMATWCMEEIKHANPKSERIYQALGENYQKQGRNELAIRAFQKAAQANPRLPGIQLSLAGLYAREGQTKAAQEAVDRELDLVPGSQAAMALKNQLGHPSQ